MSVFDPSLERNPIRPVVRDEREMAMLRHDIRAALAGVVGGARHLARAEIDQEVWPQVERIVASANALEWLIAQAFGDARTSDGPPETDADRLIAHLRHRFAGAAGETRRRLPRGDGPRPAVAPAPRAGGTDAGAREPGRDGARVGSRWHRRLRGGDATGRDRLSSNERSERRSLRPGSRLRARRRRDRGAGRADACRPPRGSAGADRRDRRANARRRSASRARSRRHRRRRPPIRGFRGSASCSPRTIRPTRWSRRTCCARLTPRCWSAATGSRRWSGSTTSRRT